MGAVNSLDAQFPDEKTCVCSSVDNQRGDVLFDRKFICMDFFLIAQRIVVNLQIDCEDFLRIMQ